MILDSSIGKKKPNFFSSVFTYVINSNLFGVTNQSFLMRIVSLLRERKKTKKKSKDNKFLMMCEHE
jgi:membrane protein insertase Oxa1/YidC/SpoIIIJ